MGMISGSTAEPAPVIDLEHRRPGVPAVVAFLAFAAFSIWIHYEVKFAHREPSGTVEALGDLRIGAPAPAFAVQDLSGATISLDAMRGNKIVLLEFWASWCPPCRMVLATLRRMTQALQDDDVEVLSVDQGESAETVRRFATTEAIPFHVVLDPDASVSRRYRVTVLPTMVLVDRRGIIRWMHVGHMPETDELRDVLHRIAKE
jgi:peroxiredoxin